MPTEVYLVKVGMNMTEGVVEEWYVADGDIVAKGELLYRLETEKVNLDVDAEASGTVKHLVAEGVTMEPGDLVGYIYADGELIPDELPSGTDTPATARSAAAAPDQTPLTPPPTPADAPISGAASTARAGRIKASPAARRLAATRGIDLSRLPGSGPGGRIVEADVLTATADAPSGSAGGRQRSSPMARKRARELGVSLEGLDGTGPGGRITLDDVESAGARGAAPSAGPVDEPRPLSGMRRTIASRMHESLMRSAQLTMDMDVQMDDAVKLRTQLVAEWADRGLRPTYTDLVVRAVAKALPRHPALNSELTESALVLKGEVNVGIAVALDDGLIVPVVRNADRLSMEDLVAASARLADAARSGGLTPDDVQGGTFTVSALGMFGVDSFTPIINMPQAGILGVNRIRDDTRWTDSGPVRSQVMRLSLTWDHRVLDGAPAARFLGEVRDLLEAPFRLLV